MNIGEIFEKAEITSDTKARRVANVAPNQIANITADEIENGVTIERLETIGVPILKYAGQITIHGKLPEFNPDSRPGGYKAVFQNQNGSIGVKYVALDAAKKKQIAEASCYAAKNTWSASINSKGLTVMGFFHEKADCLEAFKSFPRDLFAGSICAFPGLYGGYYVEVAIGVVYEQHVWPLIAHCFGFSSAADLQAAIEAKEREYAVRHAEYEKERKEREVQKTAQLTQTASTIGLQPLQTIPKGECAFVRIINSWSDGPVPMLFIVRKKAFGQLCYTTRRWQRGLTTFEPAGKMKRFDDFRRKLALEDCQKGLVFQPA